MQSNQEEMRNLRSAFYLLYAGLALLIAACSTLTAAERAQREREVAMQVEKALAERQYTISISMMFPRRGNAVSVTPDYSVQMKGDCLISEGPTVYPMAAAMAYTLLRPSRATSRQKARTAAHG